MFKVCRCPRIPFLQEYKVCTRSKKPFSTEYKVCTRFRIRFSRAYKVCTLPGNRFWPSYKVCTEAGIRFRGSYKVCRASRIRFSTEYKVCTRFRIGFWEGVQGLYTPRKPFLAVVQGLYEAQNRSLGNVQGMYTFKKAFHPDYKACKRARIRSLGRRRYFEDRKPLDHELFNPNERKTLVTAPPGQCPRRWPLRSIGLDDCRGELTRAVLVRSSSRLGLVGLFLFFVPATDGSSFFTQEYTLVLKLKPYRASPRRRCKGLGRG